MKEILVSKIHKHFSPSFSLLRLLGIFAGISQRPLVDESGMIRIQTGSTIDQKIATVHGTLCTILSRNNNQQL
jgi:hypothetical protein